LCKLAILNLVLQQSSWYMAHLGAAAHAERDAADGDGCGAAANLV
jgi:hypothetical protein